jgi:hypothetical protein
MQVPNMDGGEQLDRFVRGLKAKTRKEVVMREPVNLDEAIRLADWYDFLITGFGLGARYTGFRSGVQSQGSAFTNPNPAPGPTPMKIDALKRKSAPLTQAWNETTFARLGGASTANSLATSWPTVQPNPSSQLPGSTTSNSRSFNPT